MLYMDLKKRVMSAYEEVSDENPLPNKPPYTTSQNIFVRGMMRDAQVGRYGCAFTKRDAQDHSVYRMRTAGKKIQKR